MEQVVQNILRARVYDVAVRTPLHRAHRLSERLGHEIWLKREDLQPVFSFKIRGAYNKIAHLTPLQQKKGVICASAGNHAQGVALSAKKLGLRAMIVMPETTPEIKVTAVESLGGEPVLVGQDYSEAFLHAKKLAEKTKATMIHPFDDPLVIAGQGTIGKEIYEDMSSLAAVFVPVGGGGLAAGVASYIKMVDPSIKVYGVEPEDSQAMAQSLAKGERVSLEKVGLFADGVAVKQVGEQTFSLCQKYLDGVILVSTDDIASAISDIYLETRAITEPAGALSLAGLKRFARSQSSQGALVAINSGANMNFQRLQFVAERALTGAGREALFAIHLAERPGTLKELCSKVFLDHAVTEFNYRKSPHEDAVVFAGVGVSGEQDHKALVEALERAEYSFEDLTDNELAKEHIRHMVGGRNPDLVRERLVRFAFPEHPGALSRFLELLSERWNISLFHYRSHGADFGRVLIGFEVEDQDEDRFGKFLEKVGYPYEDESENIAYGYFL